jgi:hypothetical protein
VVGTCEHYNEPLNFIRGENFLDQLCNYKLLRKDCALRSWLKVLVTRQNYKMAERQLEGIAKETDNF